MNPMVAGNPRFNSGLNRGGQQQHGLYGADQPWVCVL